MSKPLVTGVRSIELGVTDPAASLRFYTDLWHLERVADDGAAVYLRATGPHHHVVVLRPRAAPALLRIDLTAPDRAAVDALHAGLRGAGVARLETPAPLDEPGGGYGFGFQDPDGRTLRVVADGARHADTLPRPDRPTKITHVVLNTPDRAASADFYCRQLGFRVIDETKMLTFLSCSRDHHSIAFAHGATPTLHHVAFEMPDLEAVMRGAGRLRDGGVEIAWGVGRHGPGNNVFAYFVGPDEVVVEYTAEVEQVDERYAVHGPDYWVWPPGRTDQWGIAQGPTERLKQAQTRIGFTPELLRAG